MRVLSLFDGMACGMIAFKVAGIPIDSYDAYEIDKFAVQVATHNFPEIREHGDVFKADFTEYEGVDYVIGGSPCFTKGHLVLTVNGYKDISDIEVGDLVLTHKGRYQPVTAVGQKKAKIYEVDAMGYPKFKTTANHPFYTISRRKATYSEYKEVKSWRIFSTEPEWKRADALTNDDFVGMRIVTTLDKLFDVTEHIDAEFCYILGRYLADGHLRKAKRKNRKNSYQYQVVLSIGENKIDEFKANVKNAHFSCFKHSQSVYRCVFSSQKMLEFIDKHIGRGSHNKKIPEFVFWIPREQQIAFLKGYMDGDGCKVGDKWTAATVSPYIAFGLQRLVTTLYNTNVSVSVGENNRKHTINGREIKSNYPLYQIGWKEELKKQTVAHVQDGILWTQVRSTRQTDNVDTVYNLTVAGDNSYTVNNCIVHNCTYWSIAQSPDKRETTASGIGWELFSQYVRAIKEAKPKYFIYENNKSMAKAIYDSISATFGFEPIMINSALVSAQNRERYYWVGKRNEYGDYDKVRIEQPKDRGIMLKDILITGESLCQSNREKSTAVMAHYHKEQAENTFLDREKPVIVAEPLNTQNRTVCINTKDKNGKQPQQNERVYNPEAKAVTVTSGWMPQTLIRVMDRELESVKNADSGIIAIVEGKEHEQIRRVRETNGKGETVSTCEGGNREPKVFMQVKENTKQGYCEINPGECVDLEYENSKTRRGRKMQDKANALKTSNEFYQLMGNVKLHKVENGHIEIKGKKYPVKLKDGYYVIRKLTVRECARLQTIPEWYEFNISNSQAYKCIGNGWTIEVIAHLIRATQEGKTEAKQLTFWEV